MTVVLDANVVVGECLSRRGFSPYSGEDLVAPLIMWSEVTNSFHESAWRGEISRDGAAEAAASPERHFGFVLSPDEWVRRAR